MQYLTALAIAVATATSVTARQVTVENNCPFTIWYGLLPLRLAFILNSDNFFSHRPALYTDVNAGGGIPSQPTGWQQDAFQSLSFGVPDNWKAGRIWVRPCWLAWPIYPLNPHSLGSSRLRLL
jgi:hypothetical protein